MEEVQNTAAADATVKSPETITPPAATAEPAVPTANIPTANIEEFNKFVSGQGGFEKAFARWKDMVSNPQPKVEQAPVQQPQVQTQPQPQPQAQPQIQPQNQVPQGYITQEEYATEQYFRSLANDAKYEGIADQIRSGEVLKEMAEFGIRPTNVANGQLMFNDGQIRKFLDLKAQTVPAKQTAAPLTNVPTVEWSNIESVNSFAEAQKIISENLSRPGMEHPKTAEAKEFLRNFYKSK